MKITFLDGKRFRLAVIAAAKSLIRNEDYLNKINVFPVPDGDTGTNMAATLHNIITTLRVKDDLDLSDMSTHISDSALDGARGNSGSILAQMFYGLATELQDKKHVTTLEFARAAKSASDHAYEAMADPREGTILSVVRVWGEAWQSEAVINDDFASVMTYSLKEARIELDKTPSKLKIDNKMKYVDSGALGFVNMLEGIDAFIKSPNIKQLFEGLKERLAPIANVHDVAFDPNVKFRFCTECLVDGEFFDRNRIRDELMPLGDSLILAGSSRRLKLHIHTNSPETVFSILDQYGQVRRKKVDDMKKQVSHRNQKKQGIALVVDSAADVSDQIAEKYNINVVPLRISFSGKQYIDGVTIDNTMFYKMLKESKETPKTSQPAPRDIENLYRFLLSHYEEIISIHVSKELSGTYQNAIAAARRVNPAAIHVINSKSGSMGQQIMAIKAAEMIRQEFSVREIVTFLESLEGKQKIYVVLKTLYYAIKGGRVKPYLGRLLGFLGLIPLITFTVDGKSDKDGLVANRGRRGWKTMIKRFKKHVHGQEPTDIGIIHANDSELAKEFAQFVRNVYPKARFHYGEFGPVVGTYAGTGALLMVGFVDAEIPVKVSRDERIVDKLKEKIKLPEIAAKISGVRLLHTGEK